MIVINYSMTKKMGFLISTIMIYHLFGNFSRKLTKIITSTILVWAFTKINNVMSLFKFSPILNIKLSAKFLSSKGNLRFKVIRKMPF